MRGGSAHGRRGGPDPPRLGFGSRSTRVALAGLLQGLVLLTACRPAAETGPTAIWRNARPRAAIVHLVDAPATVDGRSSAQENVVARWSGSALRSWEKTELSWGVRLTSPTMRLRQSGRLRIVLTPGGATRVRITPLLHASERLAVQRRFRTFEVPLERDADPESEVTIEADLTEALYGSWGDASRGGALRLLEIDLPDARAEQVRLRQAVVYHRAAVLRGVAAGTGTVEHRGTLRPSWMVRGGATARIELRVPEGRSVLRWHDAALPGSGARTVSLIDGAEMLELSRSASDGGWRLRGVPLSRWAGRGVVLQLACEGEGIGFFGDPRIVPLTPAASRPDVLVYLIDTLRADHLGAWGANLPGASPNLDRLASEGVAFELAISTSSWTKPAIPTLMTGILPTTHRVGSKTYSDRLPPTVALVQQRFRERGWRTASFSASALGSTLSGLERGFGAAFPPRFWRGRAQLDTHPAANQLHAAMLHWLDEEPDQPFFVYVHTLEVHEWPRPFYKVRPDGFTPYDAAIQDADRKLGQLLSELRARGRADNLLIVVVSDHGEALGHHSLLRHGSGLFQSQVHVPLIFWAPGVLRPATVAEPVSLADVAPTLLDLFGLPALAGSQGTSLRPYLEQDEPPPGEFVSSALIRYFRAPDAPRQVSLVSRDRLKIIRTSAGERYTFDLGRDPGEAENLSESPRLERALDAWLERQVEAEREFQARHGGLEPAAFDAEEGERLRALGYAE